MLQEFLFVNSQNAAVKLNLIEFFMLYAVLALFYPYNGG